MRAKSWRLGWIFVMGAVAGCGGSKDGGQGGAGGAGASAGGASANGGGGGDEGPCTPGQARSCYEGPAGTKGVGICKGGTQTCKADGSGFGACEGQVLPKKEDCATPEDEDCDGKVNQASAGCVCTPGDQKACYDGPDGTEGVGICKAGSKICADDGKSWGDCDGQVLPMTEDCNTRGDENCDGVACSDAIWDRVAGNGKGQFGSAIGIDSAGNTYVSGAFEGTLDFGGGSVSANKKDGYLAKYDPTGALLWFRQFPSTAKELYFSQLSVSASGTIALSGWISGEALTFGSKTIDGTTVTSSFAGMFDTDGNQLWVHEIQGSTDVSAYAVAFDSAGAVVVGGGFYGSLTCATAPCPTSVGGEDAFVRKYDATGAEQWTHHYGGAGNDAVVSLGARADGHMIVAGEFSQSIDLVGNTYPSAGGNDIFVVHADASGNGVWAFALGSSQSDSAAVAVRPDGSFILGGQGGGPLALGGVTTGPLSGAFVFSFAKDGTPQWAKSFSTSGSSQVQGLVSDSQGNVVFNAVIDSGTADFGGGPIMNTEVYDDAAVTKLSPDGTVLWSKSFVGPGEQGGPRIAMNGPGRVALSLGYQGSIDFGLGMHTSTNAPDTNNEDLALVNFQP